MNKTVIPRAPKISRALQPSLPQREAGFSLIETLSVVGIGVILMSILMPNMMTAIANARLRGNISTLSGIYQNCRMLAIKNNRVMTTHSNPGSGMIGITAYVKLASDTSALSSSDPQVELEAPILQYSDPTTVGGPAGLPVTTLGFTATTGDASYNSYGLPCSYSSGTCTNNGFVYYFQDTRRTGNSGWAAVSISPAGRIKKWFWNGNTWSN